MDKKLLGRRINMARKDRGLTSEKLSELCDVNATYLRQIESGAKMPSLPLFVCLCEKLRISADYLLAGQWCIAENAESDALLELQRRASPGQLQVIRAMIESALAAIKEGGPGHAQE